MYIISPVVFILRHPKRSGCDMTNDWGVANRAEGCLTSLPGSRFFLPLSALSKTTWGNPEIATRRRPFSSDVVRFA